MADTTGTCFLPRYELEPLTVFNAVRTVVRDMSEAMQIFNAKLIVQPGAADADAEVGGGASAHELVTYAAAPKRGSFAQAPQSSAVLLDLLRW